MASRDLILRIGADAGPIKKALGQLNNTLVKTADKLESIGQSLSLRLTAPIVGAGVASVAAFAKFEKFEKSLRAVSSSAAEADATLSRLRKLALQPGIDLENAVTGSIRLQAVGFEAKKAEELILQFSKAVTLAGGTGEDLGEVVRQITQIISKGKVLSSDFRVIQERVPAIGIALQTAFGSTNIEQIRETGISAADFVDKLTDGIRASQEFQNVQGGLSNSFNNFQQSVEGSLVVLGRTISETINLEGVLDGISNTIADAANGFASLSPGLKTAILGVAGFAAALGPLSFGIGVLLKTLPLLSSGIAVLIGPIGAVLAGVGLLVAVFLKYNNQLSVVEQAQNRLNEVLSDAQTAADGEREAVSKLVGVIQSETASKGEKARAIEELKRISGDYFGNLDIEKLKTSELTDASNQYNLSLVKRKQLQKLEEEETRAKAELLSLTEDLNKATSLGGTLLGIAFGNATSFVSGVGKSATKVQALRKEIELLGEQRTAILEQPDEPIIVPKVVTPITGSKSTGPASPKREAFGPLASITSGSGEAITSLSQIDAAVRAASGSIATIGQISEEAFGKLVDADIQGFADRITTTVNPLTTLGETFDLLQTKSDVFGSSFDLLQEKLSATQSALALAIEEGYAPTGSVIEGLTEQMFGLTTELERQQSLMENMATVAKAYSSAFEAASGSQIKGFADVGRAALGAAKDVVKAKLLEATASFFADAFAKLGIFGAVLAAGAGAIVGGLFGTVTSALKIPALAEGGITTGPTLALIGEGRENEAIIPLSKLDTIINNGSGGQQELTARISGEDLLLLIRRVQTTENRIG